MTAPDIMLRLVAVTQSTDELVRQVYVHSFADVCTHISSLVAEIERERTEHVIKVMVQSNHKGETNKAEALSVVNICGKITHVTNLHLHAPGVKAYVQNKRNNFGVTDRVYTRFGNFHTGSNRTSTLFRAGTSSSKIRDAISHVFVLDNVQHTSVHNIVYNARLGRPVASKNDGIRHALVKLRIGTVLLCLPIEESMFVHCLKLSLQDTTVLQTLGLEGMADASVRVNICRTGVVNFFVGLPGGVPLISDPELRVVAVCETLLQAILSAT